MQERVVNTSVFRHLCPSCRTYLDKTDPRQTDKPSNVFKALLSTRSLENALDTLLKTPCAFRQGVLVGISWI